MIRSEVQADMSSQPVIRPAKFISKHDDGRVTLLWWPPHRQHENVPVKVMSFAVPA